MKQTEVLNYEKVSYPVVSDDVRVLSENAFILLNICKEAKMVLLNNVKVGAKHFLSDKTYKKGSEWFLN